MPDWNLSLVGDVALRISFGEGIDLLGNSQAVRCAECIRQRQIVGVLDVVPSYSSVTVHFHQLRTDLEGLVKEIESIAVQVSASRVEAIERRVREIVIPVCYGGLFGPDLSLVADFADCSQPEVVKRHLGSTYRVYMMGFLPGFAYMAEVESSISMPRRSTPRLSVPSGSVGIAGRQTGIYPLDAPGGWRLVGRTPLQVYSTGVGDAFLLKPGDTVRFRAIDQAEFKKLSAET